MLPLKLLILIQGLISGLSADQPEDVVFADPGSSVNLTCASNTSCQTKCRSWWYRRKEHDMWTVVNNTSLKPGSRSEANIHLVIDNVTSQDLGRYYCSAFDGSNQVFSKGTTLIIGDISAFNTSIHLLTPLKPITHPFSIPLACVVYTSSQQVYLIWKISGTHIKGNMFFFKKPNGTWTVVNSISLSKDVWKNGERLTCEVWFNSSSPVSVYWEIPQSSNHSQEKDGTSTCWILLIMSVICEVALVSGILTYHIYKHIETRKLQRINYNLHKSNGNETDNIVYTELKIHSQTCSRRCMKSSSFSSNV